MGYVYACFMIYIKIGLILIHYLLGDVRKAISIYIYIYPLYKEGDSYIILFSYN